MSASINIFAPNLVPRWKINCLKKPICHKSNVRKSIIWAMIWASININFCILEMENQHQKNQTHVSIIRFSTSQHVRHLEFDQVPKTQLRIEILHRITSMVNYAPMTDDTNKFNTAIATILYFVFMISYAYQSKNRSRAPARNWNCFVECMLITSSSDLWLSCNCASHTNPLSFVSAVTGSRGKHMYSAFWKRI